MEIKITTENNITYLTVLEVSGMFELEQAAEVEEEIKRGVGKGSKDIAVDFSAIKLLNSAAISRLISMIRFIQKENGRLAFWGLNEDLLQILNFVNIPNFAIANSKEGAQELFI